MNTLQYHKVDSQRFGLVIYRADELEEIDAQSLLNQILEHNIDVAILRIPTVKLSQLQRLERTAMPFIVADTLAYYQKDLTSIGKQEVNPALTFKLAGPEDHPDLDRIVRETFGSYVNHYRINPFFDNQNVTDGYMDWMQSYAENNPQRLCWLIEEEGETIGFATFNLQTEGQIKGILYGVRPAHRRKGIFRDIMRYAQNYALEKGDITLMETTTQIENIGPQKLWASEGFNLAYTKNTIHINALLTKSVFENFTVPMTIQGQDSDTPKVSNRHILKQINWQFDFKQNIVTRNHKFVNIEPMHVDVEYQMHFSFPTGNKGLLRVTDEKGTTFVLVYFDLRHFMA